MFLHCTFFFFFKPGPNNESLSTLHNYLSLLESRIKEFSLLTKHLCPDSKTGLCVCSKTNNDFKFGINIRQNINLCFKYWKKKTSKNNTEKIEKIIKKQKS